MSNSPSMEAAVARLNLYLTQHPTTIRHLMQASAIAHDREGDDAPHCMTGFGLLRILLREATGQELSVDQDSLNRITGFRVKKAESNKQVWAIPVIVYVDRNPGEDEQDTAEDQALSLLRQSGLEVVLAEDFSATLVDDNAVAPGHPPREILEACAQTTYNQHVKKNK